jgi:hypothetical protein
MGWPISSAFFSAAAMIRLASARRHSRLANCRRARDLKVDACSIYLEANWNPSVWHTQARRWLLWGGGMASCGRLVIGALASGCSANDWQAGCQPAAGCHPAPQGGKPQTTQAFLRHCRRCRQADCQSAAGCQPVANLPHIASATYLRWYRIVAAREDWNGL